MKKILITGKNSYIGTSFFNNTKQYEIDFISVRGEDWRLKDFSSYDVILHTAGIVHADIRTRKGQEYIRLKKYYYEINRNLTLHIAKKAKQEGVKQFIFLSSIIIYGDSAKIGKRKKITSRTIPKPTNFYGASKLAAEKGLEKLKDNTFKVAILRLPMIYGKQCKGNFSKLIMLAKYAPCFPKIKNERSMLYIKNLCEFIRLIIEEEKDGIFYPQNAEFSNTSNMVKELASHFGRRLHLCYGANLLPLFLQYIPGRIGKTVTKVFGNFVYEPSLSKVDQWQYQIYSLPESIADMMDKK